MKTRDELAEALLIASVEESKIMPAATALNLADAFVAERERRARPIPADEATLRLDYDQANVIALALGYDASALPLGQAIEKIKELASRAPAQKPHSPDAKVRK